MVIGIIIGTLITAALIYFLCGGFEADKNPDMEGSNKSGCITLLIVAFILTIILLASSGYFSK